MENEENKVEETSGQTVETVEKVAEEAPQPKKGSKGLWLVIGIILAVVILGKLGNKGTNGGTPTPAATPTPIPTPLALSVKELADDYDADQVAAETKWIGKLVEFTAKISALTDTGITFTKLSDKAGSKTEIDCKNLNPDDVALLKKGQSIVVKGTIGANTLGVIEISDCAVVK
jgi:hypothetical protein